MEFTINCTLHDFSIICQELQTKYGSCTRFFPSISSIRSQLNPLSQKHAVFENYYTILDWISINSSEELKTFVLHEVKRKGIQLLQVMGGAHWNMENIIEPLQMFVGKSCSRFLRSVKQEDTSDQIHSNIVNEIEFSPSTNVSTTENKLTCVSIPTTQ